MGAMQDMSEAQAMSDEERVRRQYAEGELINPFGPGWADWMMSTDTGAPLPGVAALPAIDYPDGIRLRRNAEKPHLDLSVMRDWPR